MNNLLNSNQVNGNMITIHICDQQHNNNQYMFDITIHKKKWENLKKACDIKYSKFSKKYEQTNYYYKNTIINETNKDNIFCVKEEHLRTIFDNNLFDKLIIVKNSIDLTEIDIPILNNYDYFTTKMIEEFNIKYKNPDKSLILMFETDSNGLNFIKIQFNFSKLNESDKELELVNKILLTEIFPLFYNELSNNNK
jgi:hypothetical protein